MAGLSKMMSGGAIGALTEAPFGAIGLARKAFDDDRPKPRPAVLDAPAMPIAGAASRKKKAGNGIGQALSTIAGGSLAGSLYKRIT